MPGGAPLLAFGLLAALVLVSAVWVVTLRNLFRAALSLGLVLLGIAGFFILLEADFLAFVQILVYVGAILTLVVFAIMLTAKLHGSPTASASRQRMPAAAVSLGLFVTLVFATQSLAWPTSPSAEPVPLATLGQQLVTTLILPFEVVSLVLLAAIVGAIAIATAPSSAPPPSVRDGGRTVMPSPAGIGVGRLRDRHSASTSRVDAPQAGRGADPQPPEPGSPR